MFARELVNGLVEIAGESYFRNKDKGEAAYYCAFGSVLCWALNSLYVRLTKSKEIKPIEEIELSKKQQYWNISEPYKENSANHTRIEVSKAIYVLDIITTTE